MTVSTSPDGTTLTVSTSRRFLYDGWNLIAEYSPLPTAQAITPIFLETNGQMRYYIVFLLSYLPGLCMADELAFSNSEEWLAGFHGKWSVRYFFEDSLSTDVHEAAVRSTDGRHHVEIADGPIKSFLLCYNDELVSILEQDKNGRWHVPKLAHLTTRPHPHPRRFWPATVDQHLITALGPFACLMPKRRKSPVSDTGQTTDWRAVCGNRSAAEINRPEGGPARGERSESNPQARFGGGQTNVPALPRSLLRSHLIVQRRRRLHLLTYLDTLGDSGMESSPRR